MRTVQTIFLITLSLTTISLSGCSDESTDQEPCESFDAGTPLEDAGELDAQDAEGPVIIGDKKDAG
jgi:hypothetical protein